MSLVNTKKRPDKRRCGGMSAPVDAVMAVSGGLIGNVAWLTELAATRPPPYNMAGMVMGHFFSIDDMGVYDESLWVLHKQVLELDIDAFAGLSQALQARLVTAAEIRDVVRAYDMGNAKGPEAVALRDALLAKAGVTIAPKADPEAPSPVPGMVR